MVRKPQNDPFKTIEGKDLTRVPMMQVIEEDTYDNYVVCQGYDPDYDKFFERLSIAKPYGQRGQTGLYSVGEVHPAVKPITIIGTTPGVAETTGHPADLDEAVVKLTDDEGTDVQWMFIGGGGGGGFGIAKLTSTLSAGLTATAELYDYDDDWALTKISGDDDPTIKDAFLDADTHVARDKYVGVSQTPSGKWIATVCKCDDIEDDA